MKVTRFEPRAMVAAGALLVGCGSGSGSSGAVGGRIIDVAVGAVVVDWRPR